MTNQKKKRIKRAGWGVLAFLLTIAVWDHIPFAGQIEQITLDFRYAHFNRNSKPSDEIVLIDIDEQSIKNLAPTYGRWPWPRRVYKELISFLSLGEPAAILFDILFSEAQLGTQDDAYLAEASEASGVTSHALQFIPDPAQEGVSHVPLPEEVGRRFGLNIQVPPTYKLNFEAHDFLLPNEVLFAKIPKLHFVNVNKDQDGILRRVPTVFQYDSTFLPSLSFQGVLSKVRKPKVEIGERLVKIFENGKLRYTIPLDQNNLLPLHFYSDQNRPTSLPFASVIESATLLQQGKVADPAELPINPLELAGKVILVGASATGLQDLKVTPVNPSYPGVLLHTTAISNVFKREFLNTPPTWWGNVFAIVFLVFAYGFVFFGNSLFLKMGVPVLALATYAFAVFWSFQNYGLALPMSQPIGFGFFGLLDSFIYLSLIEGKERKKITGTLSKYLAPTVTQQLIENGVDPTAEVGHSKELSILFSDIRGFTSMSEQYEPAFVVGLLNEYLEHMTDLVFKHQGTLDKFIGDAVMAFWGAPVDDAQHAVKAVATGLEMLEGLNKLNSNWKAKGQQTLEIGIGINTGQVIVGNIGSNKRLDYTVIGDNVNTASRLEGLTKHYKSSFIIGERTYDLVKDKFLCRPLDLVQAKGKANAIRIFEPVAAISSATDSNRELVDEFCKAWTLYQNGDFSQALVEFEKLSIKFQDGPSFVYIERCRALVAEPPQNWSGVYVAKSK